MVAAAVIVPSTFDTTDINDSKKLTAAKRSRLFEKIMSSCKVGIGRVSPLEIDTNGLGWARRQVFLRALNDLDQSPSKIIVDGNNFFDGFNDVEYECVVKADAKYISVAAASIIAKCTRDTEIETLCNEYPEESDKYGWSKNKGYPTKAHIDAIKLHEITKHHRKSYKPCQQIQ